MKKIFFTIIFIFILTSVFSLRLSLKDEVIIYKNNLKISDLIKENVSDDIGKIEIGEIKFFPYKLKNNDILKKFFENGFFDITLSGEESIIYLLNEDSKKYLDENQQVESKIQNPIDFLEEYLSKYIDKNKFKIKINLTKIEPFLDIENLNEEYKWELNKMKFGLKDIADLKKLDLNVGKRKYDVNIDVNIYADVFFSKQSFLKDDIVYPVHFIAKNIDITAFRDAEQLVFDVEKASNSKFITNIGTGEVLKWSVLKKIPLVVRDQGLKIKIDKAGMNISINCVAVSDAYENEKIKVKLNNGKEKIGVLRKNNGECYVELL
jgi:flagella basal body P-ring formation protein FlgA